MACSILSQLPFAERHRTAPLVCRRWRTLLDASPELRREVALFLPSRHVLPGLRSLAAWLRRGAAADVQRMRLHLHAPLLSPDAGSHAAPEGSAGSADQEQRAGEALATALADVLAACSGAGAALRQLDLHLEAAPLALGSQLAAALQAVPRLQRLSIILHRFGGLRMVVPLAGLLSLQELSLGASCDAMPPLQPAGAAPPSNEALQARCLQRGWQYCGGGGAAATSEGALAVGLEVLRAMHPCSVALLPGAALPQGLTKLCITGLAGLSLPHELTLLPRLHCLSLADLRLPTEGYAPLARMPALRRLRLARCRHHPSADCLSQLGSLRELHLVAGCPPSTALFGVDPQGPDDEPGWQHASRCQVASTLARLAVLGGSLRCLVLSGSLCGLTAADLAPLAELRGLTSLCLWPARKGGGGDGGDSHSEMHPLAAALPGSEWLSGLIQLAAPTRAMAACQGLLQGACRLQALGLQGRSQADAACLAALLHWAAAHPALRRLCLDFPGCHDLPAVQASLEVVQQGRPGLLELGDALARELHLF